MPEYAILTSCPWCSYPADRQHNLTGTRPPRAGDATVCWRCRRIGIYHDGPFGVVLRKPTYQETAKLARQLACDPQLRAVIGPMLNRASGA